MTTAAFVGGMFLERGDNGSPLVYTRICQIHSISGLGQTNAQVDATTFCSDGAKEYIAGLADGSEVTLQANYETSSADLHSMIADVQAKAKRDFRIFVDSNGDGTAEKTFYFNATCLSWTLNPAVDNRNTISYGVKINGNVTIV